MFSDIWMEIDETTATKLTLAIWPDEFLRRTGHSRESWHVPAGKIGLRIHAGGLTSVGWEGDAWGQNFDMLIHFVGVPQDVALWLIGIWQSKLVDRLITKEPKSGWVSCWAESLRRLHGAVSSVEPVVTPAQDQFAEEQVA